MPEKYKYINNLKYKIDVLSALKAKGYSTYKIRHGDHPLGEGTLQALRSSVMVSTEVLAHLCDMLDCQPGDIIEYVKPLPEGDITVSISRGVSAENRSRK